jgi:hypothetical protein
MFRAVKLAGVLILALALGVTAIVAQRESYARADASETVAAAAPADAPSPELMFKLAKGAWRARTDVPFITYNMRERYNWRGRVHDNWWTAYYRNADRDLVLHPMIVPQAEADRMKGFPIDLKISFHKGLANADSLDTNPDADAFPILEPLIEPSASFGMLGRDGTAALVGNVRPTADPRQTIAPVESPAASPSSDVTGEKPLRELARVEAVAREYTIAFAGTDHLESGDAYHLTLTPIRNPTVNRLRDLWIDPRSYATVRLAVQGLFEGKPYDGARWIVTYIALDSRYYIQNIRSAEPLRFGMDRTVTDLEYDFVSYDFPSTIPNALFQKLL